MGSDDATQPSGGPARAVATRAGERYVLDERLGEGAMGVVWRARDTQLDRDVAIKLLHDRYLGGDHQAQLAREARAMARLAHPNVVAVYDAGELDGRGFVAKELVRGEPLTRWLETPRHWQEIVAVLRGIAEALASAHAAGILHRDVKPSNILIGDDGRARLVDFGVAHASVATGLDPAAQLTATTAGLIGSPAYMSLERLCGEPADASGDQFSFCVALYEALHGRRPFDAPTIAGTIAAIARGDVQPVRDVPRWLHAVVARGLSVKASDRFASMVALNHALSGPRASRLRTLAPLAGIVVVGAIVAAIAWPRDDRAVTPTEDAPIAAPVVEAAAPVAAIPTEDAAVPIAVDAALADPPPPDGATPRPRRTAPPPPRSPKEVLAAARELRTRWKAALDQQDYRTGRRLAEQAIGLVPSDPDPRVTAATSSCHLGEERRAREHLQKLPRSQGPSRIAVVKICRRLGIELDDLLTENEALHAR